MKKIIITVLIALTFASVAAFFIYENTVLLQPAPFGLMPPIEKVGKCGDNVCDEFEKRNPDACPSDCLPAQSSQPSRPTISSSSQPSQSSSSHVMPVPTRNSTDADGFMWGTEAGEFYGYPYQTAQINNQVNIINNNFGVNIVKFRLQTKLEHKLIGTTNFNHNICPSSSCFDMDNVVKIFNKNGWSMVPMLSGISPDNKITSEDIETYVNFVDWFVSRYKNDANIKIVELENAPQDWWHGTGEQLVEVSNKIYDRIKTKYPDILVGTPGLEYSIDKTVSELKKEAQKESFETFFLDKKNEARFDFWAFHGYPVLSPDFVNKKFTKYPPTKIALKNKYANVVGIVEIRKKMDGNGWKDRKIIDTEHVGFAQIGPDFPKKDDEFDSAYLLQEIVLKRTLKLNGRNVLDGMFPLKIVPRGKGGEYQWGSLNSDGSLTNNVRAVVNFISLLNKYGYHSHLSGQFDDEDTPWIEKFQSKEGNELYVYFKPFKFNEEMGFLDFDREKLKYEINLTKAPSSVSLIDPITGKNSKLTVSQKISLEAENMPKFLEIKYPTPSTDTTKQASKQSPFGFHPGNANNYSYIKDLGSFWSREGVYLRWEWADANRDGKFKFTKATAPARKELSIQALEINYDEQWLNAPENINLVANVCPFAAGGEFSSSAELLTYKDFVKKAVERYGGGENYGCALQSPDCYNKGDGQYPNSKVIDKFKKNPIKYWQVCNQLTETCNGRDCPQTYAENYAEVQKTTYEAVKEANGNAKVLIAGDSGKGMYPDVYKKLGGKYIDIIDFHRFGNNYNPKEDFDYLKSSLHSAGFDTSKLKFWMTETGTYSGDPSSDPDKNLPYVSEKQQAAVLVKIYVSALSYKIDKIFWAWNIVEGFSRDGGIFDYTGLVYDGCDFVNNKYECGSNIGYDKGKGVKKLSYYAYKKMVEILDGSDWDDIQTVQEKDGVYVYKFMKNGKPIWVAWNDNASEKEITISGISSPSVKITEAVPNYISGKDVKDYSAAFLTKTSSVENGKVMIKLKDAPVFVEEN